MKIKFLILPFVLCVVSSAYADDVQNLRNSTEEKLNELMLIGAELQLSAIKIRLRGVLQEAESLMKMTPTRNIEDTVIWILQDAERVLGEIGQQINKLVDYQEKYNMAADNAQLIKEYEAAVADVDECRLRLVKN